MQTHNGVLIRFAAFTLEVEIMIFSESIQVPSTKNNVDNYSMNCFKTIYLLHRDTKLYITNDTMYFL